VRKSTSQGVLRSSAESREKTSHQVWRCVGEEDVLRRIRDGAHSVWRSRERDQIDVELSPLQQAKFVRFLDSRTCVTKIANLDRAVSEDASRAMRFQGIPPSREALEQYQKRLERQSSKDFLDHYHSVEEIHNWMEKIQKENPKKIRLVESEHTSVEGRKILAARICASEDSSACESMGKIYIQGLLHAREWIGGAAVLFVISEMMKLSPNSPLLDFEIVAVPVVNPDGYEFTRLKSGGDRTWRKNRRKNLGGEYVVFEREVREYHFLYQHHLSLSLLVSHSLPASLVTFFTSITYHFLYQHHLLSLSLLAPHSLPASLITFFTSITYHFLYNHHFPYNLQHSEPSQYSIALLTTTKARENIRTSTRSNTGTSSFNNKLFVIEEYFIIL